MQEAQLSSVTCMETWIKKKKKKRCEEERLLCLPCLSISSITALTFCSVIFTEVCWERCGSLLSCCTSKSTPGGRGRSQSRVHRVPPRRSCFCTLTKGKKKGKRGRGVWFPAFPVRTGVRREGNGTGPGVFTSILGARAQAAKCPDRGTGLRKPPVRGEGELVRFSTWETAPAPQKSQRPEGNAHCPFQSLRYFSSCRCPRGVPCPRGAALKCCCC